MSQDDPQHNPPSDQHVQQSPDDSDAPEPFLITLPDDPVSGRDWGLWASVLALLILVAFWSSIQGDFLWQDTRYVIQTTAFLTIGGLKRIWFSPVITDRYAPLTYSVLWLETHFWTRALGYHIVNLVLHAGAAVMLWRILRRLSVRGSWAIAALWAVHPLQTESVSWIAQLQTVLGGTLAMASVLLFLEFAELRMEGAQAKFWNWIAGPKSLVISLILFLAALSANWTVCAVPLALLAILWWKDRLNPRVLGGLAALFVLGLVGAIIVVHMDAGLVSASNPDYAQNLNISQAILQTAHNFWFGIGKLVFPHNDSLLYAAQPLEATALNWFLTAAMVLALLALAVSSARLGRGPFTAILSYLFLSLPFAGLIALPLSMYSLFWDHFIYLSSTPIIALVIASVASRIKSSSGPQSVTSDATPTASWSTAWPAAVVALLLILASVFSWIRAAVFTGNTALWQDVAAKNPDSWFASYSLAIDREATANREIGNAHRLASSDVETAKQGVENSKIILDDAQHLLEQTLANSATPQATRIQAYVQLADLELLRAQLQGADVQALMNSATDYLNSAIQGESQDSSLPPSYLAHYTLGLVHLKLADTLQRQMVHSAPTPGLDTTRPASPDEQKVIDQYESARDALKQAQSIAHTGVQSQTINQGAIDRYWAASIKRANADFTLSALAQARHDNSAADQYMRDAQADFTEAVRANPKDFESFFHLALCYEHFNEPGKALDSLKRSLLAAPQSLYAPAYDESGMILVRNNPGLSQLREAIIMFQTAASIDPNQAEYKRHLDMANAMLASARPVTQPSTMLSTAPAPTRP